MLKESGVDTNKPIGEVLSDLSGKWSSLSDESTDIVAESLAGKRNKEAFKVAMQSIV